MFHLEVILLVAVFCAVNAAVIINVYDDTMNKEETKEQEVELCDDKGCSGVCLILGFTSGTCSGDTCECKKFQKEEDHVEQKEIPSLDYNDIGITQGDCNPDSCYRLCHMKFPSGSCINGSCQCDNFFRSEQPDYIQKHVLSSQEENDVVNGLMGCNPSACDQHCRRLKFHSGTCINGRCKCDNFRPEQSDQLEQNILQSLEENDVVNRLMDCNPSECDQRCRRLKFPGGVCINGRCKCDNFRPEQSDQLEQNSISNLHEGVSGTKQKSCNPKACYQRCRMMFSSGTCFNGRCKCDNFQPEQPVIEKALDKDVNKDIDNSFDQDNYILIVMESSFSYCNQESCAMGCRESGFPTGSCSLGKCRCDKADNEGESLKSVQECNNVNCVFMCIRWGYIGGSCRNGACLCV